MVANPDQSSDMTLQQSMLAQRLARLALTGCDPHFSLKRRFFHVGFMIWLMHAGHFPAAGCLHAPALAVRIFTYSDAGGCLHLHGHGNHGQAENEPRAPPLQRFPTSLDTVRHCETLWDAKQCETRGKIGAPARRKHEILKRYKSSEENWRVKTKKISRYETCAQESRKNTLIPTFWPGCMTQYLSNSINIFFATCLPCLLSWNNRNLRLQFSDLFITWSCR